MTCEFCSVGLLTAGVVAVLGFLHYMGIFQHIRFVEGHLPETYMYGIAYRGSFSGLGGVFDKLMKTIDEHKLKPDSYVGIYHDDPKTTKAEDLRSFVAAGFKQRPDAAVIEKLAALGLKERHEDMTVAYSTYFPMRNHFSYMLAPMMVYPKCKTLFSGDDCPGDESLGGGVVELYHDDSIQFLIPQKSGTFAPIKEHWD